MYGGGRNYAYEGSAGGRGGGGRGRGGGGEGGGEGQWQRNVVCKFYLQNRCSRGDSCWFIHSGPSADEIVPSMSSLSINTPSASVSSLSAGGSSWRRPPPAAREPEIVTGPNIINTLPDKILAQIFEHLGDNYIQLSRLALVCHKWRSISEDDAQCGAWAHAAQNYYLCQNGSMRKAAGTWKNFFGLMVTYEDNMMGDAFDSYQNDQDWGELLDDYESEGGWYNEGGEGAYEGGVGGSYYPDAGYPGGPGDHGEYYYGPQ